MSDRNGSGRKAYQVLQSQFDLLKKGTRATLYACKEWLDLGVTPTASEVVAAVHAKLHKAAKLDGADAVAVALAAMTAGRLLLIEMIG